MDRQPDLTLSLCTLAYKVTRMSAHATPEPFLIGFSKPAAPRSITAKASYLETALKYGVKRLRRSAIFPQRCVATL